MSTICGWQASDTHCGSFSNSVRRRRARRGSRRSSIKCYSAIKGLTITGRATIAGLAARLIGRHHSTVELVDRLGEAGLVRRGVDAADRRRVIVVLTAKAERILARLSAAHLDELERMSQHFAPCRNCQYRGASALAASQILVASTGSKGDQRGRPCAVLADPSQCAALMIGVNLRLHRSGRPSGTGGSTSRGHFHGCTI